MANNYDRIKIKSYIIVMQEAAEIIEKLKGVKVSLKRRYGVTDIALFGAYSTGSAQSNSDVDLLVTLDKPIGIRFVDLEEELSTLLGKPVDLTQKKGIEQKYLKSIRKELIHV